MKIPDCRLCFYCAALNQLCATGENSNITTNACVLIHKEFANINLDVNFLREHLQVSFDMIEDSFNCDLLRPPLKIIHLFRVEKSLDLIYQTDLPLSIISREVGYINKKTFRANFKKYIGLCPQDFKTTLQQSTDPKKYLNSEKNNAWLNSQKYQPYNLDKCRKK